MQPPLADRSDAELLADHCNGDPDSFGELFRRHRDRMWAVALRTTNDPELAADAVQEAFISAFRRADSFKGQSAVTTWLHRIVVNSSLDRLRRRRPTGELPDDDHALLVDSVDAHAQLDTAVDVQRALDRLPEAQRVAVILVDMYGYAVADTAEIMGVPEGTVKSRCARGRRALVEHLRPVQ